MGIDTEMYKLLTKFGKAEHFALGAQKPVPLSKDHSFTKDKMPISKTMNMKKQNV